MLIDLLRARSPDKRGKEPCDMLSRVIWYDFRVHNLTLRSRSALAMTDTELKLIAAAAIMGLNSRPKNGYRIPAAMGTPAVL